MLFDSVQQQHFFVCCPSFDDQEERTVVLSKETRFVLVIIWVRGLFEINSPEVHGQI